MRLFSPPPELTTWEERSAWRDRRTRVLVAISVAFALLSVGINVAKVLL